MGAPEERIRYKRSRFSTRLPSSYSYTLSHFWLKEIEPQLWRVGFTKFATRMLGELVEFEFKLDDDKGTEVGVPIGWVEGFKAMADLYCVVTGEFVRSNPALDDDVTLLGSDPYKKGWLYEAKGQAESNVVDVHSYIGLLDATIDKMLERQGGES
jgi:glycine cleavage system H protein